MIRTFVVLLLFILLEGVKAQSISSIGSPLVQSYNKSQYKAGNQNWGIAQGKDGVIYAANSNGLISFDGSYWELHPLDNRNSTRSVAVASNGDIYIGGKEEFGYFQKVNGKLQYHKLSQLIKPSILENDEIWKIIFWKDAVVFQSFSKLYIYKNKKIEVQYGNGEPFLFSYKINDKFWIEKIPSGLQQWSEQGFSKISTNFKNVLTILPFAKGTYLIGTAKEGVFILHEDGKKTEFGINTYVNELFRESQINNGIKINEHTFAFGTIKNGVLIVDRQGRLLQHIHKRNGLQNNTILSMMLDRQGNIWVGLDNGIDRIEINSPFYYYKDIYGEIGTVYAIKVFQNKIYIGTNQGLFYSNLQPGQSEQTLRFEFVKDSQGQVWSLDVFNNQLICGHNDGTYIVQNNSLKKISDWTGGWANVQIPESPHLFLQGNYTGLALFQDNVGWALNHKFEQPKSAVVGLFPKEANSFWVVYNNRLDIIEFSSNYKQLQVKKSFSFARDFPQVQYITPVSIQNNILFASNKGIFVYDNVLSKFKPYDEFNKKLGSYAQSKRIKHLTNDSYLFSNQGHFSLVRFNQQKISIDSTTFNSLEDVVMKNYEVVEAVGDQLIFGLDNGIAFFHQNTTGNTRITAPLINGVQDISFQGDSILYLDLSKSFTSKQNKLRILFSSAWYLSSPVQYQHMLQGYSKEWSKPSETAFIDYTNLDPGDYTFKVRAITATGFVSGITELHFKILQPWYLQWPALIFYLLLLAIGIIVARKLIIAKIKRDKIALRLKLRRRQEELLRKEAEQNENKLMALKNEQLTQELELKNRELANAAANIVFKNELLNNLNEELLNLKDKDGNKLSYEQLQKVNKLVDNARSDERDWDVFEKSFNESHENFFKKLKTDYPSLSPNDLKLCAYLRLNMSSKDIASLLNITTRGVEIRRYRLRKKFDLPTEKNLSEFLLER